MLKPHGRLNDFSEPNRLQDRHVGNTPVQLGLDLNCCVEQRDEFGPEWLIVFNIMPVVPNFINDLFRGY